MKTIYTCLTCGTVHGVDEHLGPEFALCGKCLRAKIQALMEAAKSTEDAYKRRIDRLEREVEDLEGQVSDLEDDAADIAGAEAVDLGGKLMEHLKRVRDIRTGVILHTTLGEELDKLEALRLEGAHLFGVTV